MPYIPKVPDACAGLDLALVERRLAKHYGYNPAAARELGVFAPDGMEPHPVDCARTASHCHDNPHPAAPDRQGNRAFPA
jgi:hypothetical protein